MMNPLLKAELLAVHRRQRRMRLATQLALCWGVLALLGLGAARLSPPVSSVWFVSVLIFALAAGAAVIIRHRRRTPNWHQVARRIELRHPELKGLLLTAVQQEPDSNGQFHFLQRRLVQDALIHSHTHFWPGAIPWTRVAGAHVAHIVGLACLLAALGGLWTPAHRAGVGPEARLVDGVAVTPGDTTIERGERLVVIASFTGTVPAQVDLVTTGVGVSEKRVPLVKSLSDPVFGASLPEVATDLVYRVEYDGKQTRDFKVKVFEFPRLERADADLRYPEYTGLTNKHIENTRRITAVEGTRCDWTLQLNKPVVQANLVSKGDASFSVPLAVASDRPVATLKDMLLDTNRTYLLQLVDAEGRTNKSAAPFVVSVLKNCDPELKMAAPRGDTRPSALEEVSFEGTVWDDFGVNAFGIAYTQAGGDMQIVELGQNVPAKERRTFKHLLRLEDMGAKPDEFITWFAWAEDTGPDGQIRRMAGDLYFAEVRPFDEVFRQGQGGGNQQGGNGEAGGENDNNGANGGNGGSPQTQLTELQKQIISATWKLQRQHALERVPPAAKEPKPAGTTSSGTPAVAPSGSLRDELSFLRARRVVFGQPARGASPDGPAAPAREPQRSVSGTNGNGSASQFLEDLKVVRDAVDQAISQAQSAREEQRDVRDAALWDDLIRDMEKSRDALEKAVKAPASLAEALAAEQSAFQVLLRLQQREYEVSRSRNQRQNSRNNQNSRNQQMQRQLEQLDLNQQADRYQNERQAQTPQTQERREQLQVMNRLAELARRQQDVNNRLQELQTALQEAQTEQQREEIRRELKRLQEEQQQMLADVDELQQRMNQAENQAAMNEQRQQLEQTRQDMQRTAESAQQGSVSQALASGTRAQRQLEEMREDLRQQNSSALGEDLRQLRAEAREAERRQEEIQSQMDSITGGEAKTLDDSQQKQQALEQLAQQAQRLTNLVSRATELSQQTEEAEPLASRELYDTLRQFSQDDANSVRSLEDEFIENGLVQTELYRRLVQLEKSDGVKSLELTQEMLRQGLLPQAQQAGERAGSAVSDLREGIERAAEKVIGDDTESLRLAQEQLEQLTEQVQREIAQGRGGGMTNDPARAGSREGTNSQASAGGEGRVREQRPNSDQGQANAGELRSEQDQNEQNGNGQRTQGAEQAQNGSRDQARQPGQGQPRQGEPQSPNASQQGSRRGTPPEGAEDVAQNAGGNRGARNQSPQRGGGAGGLPEEWRQFLDAGRGGNRNGPVITGSDFVPWSDSLREVEEMVEDPTLQTQLSTARDRARLLRQEYRRTQVVPEWNEVQSQVVKPLVEVRNEIAQELARRGSRESLVPIDRDPVPNRFSELVRRYYEELGKDGSGEK